VLAEYIQTSREENLEKHRFLVLSKVVDETSYATINGNKGMTAQQRQEELSRLWHVAEGVEEQKGKNIKMRVEFQYSDAVADATAGQGRGGAGHESLRSTSENVDLIRKSLAAGASSPGHGRGSVSGTPSSPSAAGIYDANDLQILKSKYDTIVEYTVHLTAERDMIAAQLDVLRRELANLGESRKEKGVKASPRKNGKGKDKGKPGDMEQAATQKGFSLVFLLLAAFVSLLLGRYS
jgi:hypothetical protein